ncbi:MAG: hypothetical protein ACLFPO_06885 [Spirochaetaceae bacterium]
MRHGRTPANRERGITEEDVAADCAIKSGSVYIVSGDPHLSEMDMAEGIPAVTPRRFVDLLKLE